MLVARFLFPAILIFCATLEAQTPRLTLVPVLTGLTQPVFLTTARDGSNRRYIVEQVGRIRVLEPDATVPTTFLDIAGRLVNSGERGLLGLAFHPQYGSNGQFYVNYTRQPDGATVVAEYRDGIEERILFTVAQPYANHNGGMIEFGPDGYLYIGMGDGGSGLDPGNHAQNLNERLGKVLRINVDVPNSQPQIFAYGFRNPWRFSFDRLTGQLFAGDVGQSSREEIDIVVQGGNYGWRVLEGTLCTGLGPASCSAPGFIPPVAEYATGSNGRCSVTGGYVYRGTQASLPYGAYVYGDFCSGEIFMLKDGVQTVLLDTSLSISSFGEDEAGEIYVVSLDGSISRLSNPDALNTAERPYATADSAPFAASTAGTAPALMVGYAGIQSDGGQPLPAGLAIFGFRQRGVLVSEASAPASPPVTSGRVLAEVGPTVNTGIALANPNDAAATVSFYFTDASGANFGGGATTIPPKRQIAAFLNEAPFSGGNSMSGTFSFASSISLAAVALRGFTNERGDFLFTTLPIVEIGASPDSTVIAHFANGGGWTTQVVLVNPSDASIDGTAQFFSRTGQIIQTTSYSIAPGSSARIATPGTGGDTQTGSLRLSSAAAAVSLFSLKTNGVTVSQAAVPTVPAGTGFRTYVENETAIRSGIAIANPSGAPADVTLEMNGLSTTLPIPANGQSAMFVNEIPVFANLPSSFRGVLRITAPTAVAVTGLRGHTNERGEFLITATAPVTELGPAGPSELFFPHFAEGEGYGMQFILFGRAASGTVSFFDQAGNPAPLLFR